jgi:phospholipid/cholesterol/gamma-HCH transport system substrate-binding protein
VILEIYNDYADLPADSSASILTSGLLGSQYVGIDVGGDELTLKEEGRILYTQSAMVLENLIGQFMVRMTGGDSK